MPDGNIMQRLAEAGVSTARELGKELDYTRGSVAAVDEALEAFHLVCALGAIGDDQLRNLALSFGAYLGETMLRNDFSALGFSWGSDTDGEPVLVGDLQVGNARIEMILPITRCSKRVRNGAADSVVDYYAMLLTTAGLADDAGARAMLGMEDIRPTGAEPNYLSAGKFDANAACWLLSEDHVFFRPDEITWDGERHRVVGMQVNAANVSEVPRLAANPSVLNGLAGMLNELEDDAGLRVLLPAIHPALHDVLRGEDLTAITLFNLQACAKALVIKEPEPDGYQVACDTRLPRGIPAFYRLVCRLIWDLRDHNGRGGAFTVTFANARNFDADQLLGQVDASVPGAASEPIHAERVAERPEVGLDGASAAPVPEPPSESKPEPERAPATRSARETVGERSEDCLSFEDREDAARAFLVQHGSATARELADAHPAFVGPKSGKPSADIARKTLDSLVEKDLARRQGSSPVRYVPWSSEQEAAEREAEEMRRAALDYAEAHRWSVTAREVASSSSLFLSPATGRPSDHRARKALGDLVDRGYLERFGSAPIRYALSRGTPEYKKMKREYKAERAEWGREHKALEENLQKVIALRETAERERDRAREALRDAESNERELERAKRKAGELAAQNKALQEKKDAIESEVDLGTREHRALVAKQESKEEELSRMGFFAFSHKRALRQEIAEVKLMADEAKQRLDHKVKVLAEVKAAASNAEISLRGAESLQSVHERAAQQAPAERARKDYTDADSRARELAEQVGRAETALKEHEDVKPTPEPPRR